MTSSRFDLARTIRAEVPTVSRRRRWGALLAIAAGTAVMLAPVQAARAAGASGGSKTVSGHDHARRTPLQAAVFGGRVQTMFGPTLAAANFDRAGSATQRRIQDATVMIVIVGRHWQLHGIGSGTLLADQKIDGHKAIATVLHVAGTRDFEAGTGVHLVVMDHDGDILGVARPLDRTLPSATRDAGIDQPVLLGFDRNYTVNAAKLAAIRGVEVAPALPAGYLFGKVDGKVGVAAGASGGGWYNARGQLIGVTDFIAAKPGSDVSVTGQSMIRVLMSGRPVADPGNTVTTQMTGRDYVAVQGLGSRNILAQLRATTIGSQPPQPHAGRADYADATGVGYPLGLQMGWHAGLKQQPELADSIPYVFDSVEAELRAEAVPATAPSEGYTQKTLTIMRAAANRIQQILAPGAAAVAPDAAEERALEAPGIGQ